MTSRVVDLNTDRLFTCAQIGSHSGTDTTASRIPAGARRRGRDRLCCITAQNGKRGFRYALPHSEQLNNAVAVERAGSEAVSPRHAIVSRIRARTKRAVMETPSKLPKAETLPSVPTCHLPSIGKVVTGGDVSGQGQGYSKAFIMSQQITNLNAGTTGELKRLAPLSKEYEDRWRTEMRLYLQLAESMSVKVPQTKKGSNGQSIQVMVDKQRQDIAENLPILKSCDERLHAVLRSFTDLDGEVEYKTKRDDGQPSSKWWIDQPFVLNCGLSRKLHTKMRKSYEDVRRQRTTK